MPCLQYVMQGIFLFQFQIWYTDSMEQDFDIKHWTNPCPKYDCRKNKCVCGLEMVRIPAPLGDDSEDSKVAPHNGAYCNSLVIYEDNGHVYIYTKEGIPTLIDVDASDISTLEQEVIKAQRDIAEFREDIERFAYFFNTVADMKASDQLQSGDYVRTLGYYAKGDGGGAYYKISNVQPSNYYEMLSGMLYAELIIESSMVLPQFGAKMNGVDDDSSAGTAMFSSCGYLDFGNKTTNLQGLTIPDGATIKNGIIKVTTSGTPFTGNNLSSLVIDNVEFIATAHKNNPAYRNNLVNLYNSSNIIIKNSKINDAACGFNFVNCENISAHDNEITGVSRFGFNFGVDNYTFGSVKNVRFYNNYMHDNPHIPLKFTGYIEDVDVHHNVGFNNTDSEETACFSFKNVKIHDNVFSHDTNRNIGFKQLDLTEYPLPSDAPSILYAENVEIYNNICLNSAHNGINVQVYYDYSCHNIKIHGNTVISDGVDDYTGIRIGVLNSTADKACQIYNNYIDLCDIGFQGILIVNALNVDISNNTVLNCKESCILLSVVSELWQSYGTKINSINISDNDLETFYASSRCVLMRTSIPGSSVDTDITNIMIFRNSFNVGVSQNQVQDKSSTTFLSQNYDGANLYDSIPSRRSANNTIYYAKDPSASGCVGWIATGSIVTPTFKTYISIS